MAFKSGDMALYSTMRAILKRGIKDNKLVYKRKIEEHFTGNNTRRMWQEVQHIQISRAMPPLAVTPAQHWQRS